MASTTERRERSQEGVPEPSERERRRAAELADEADLMVSEVLDLGRWPQERTVRRFLDEGRLEPLLSLYAQAMLLDPTEPAYPWNLSSVLRRLGQNEMALAFLTRAIHTATGDDSDDYGGPDAHLALAETALDAGESDLALVGIARARELAGKRKDVEAQARRLLAEVRELTDEEHPGDSLSRLLGALTA